MRKLILIGFACFFLALVTSAYATQTIFDDVNITKNLVVGGLKVASCDLKARLNGTLYCGTDAGGGAITGLGPANFTADLGLRWENLTTYPAACPAGQAVTAIGDAPVCAAFSANSYNASYDAMMGHNTTAEIRAAQTVNTTAEVQAAVNATGNGFYNLTAWFAYYINNATERTLFTNTYNSSYLTSSYNTSYDAQLGHNTTAEIRAAIYSTTMNLSNITNPTDCPAAQFVYGKSGALWNCRADLFNTSLEVNAAMNTTFTGQLGKNTSAEINAALNSTFTGQLGKNTTAEIRAAVYSTTMNLSNITNPSDCPAAQVVYGKSGALWQCRADLFNTSAQIQAAQTVNTTAQIIMAINNTGIGAGNITLGTLANARLDSSIKRVNDSSTLNLSNITTPSDCAANNYAYGFTSTGLLLCRADATGGAGGTNYWQTDGSFWMFPNETALGETSINATNFNATAGVNASQMCIGSTCVTAWPFNTTAQIQAAQTVNTSAQVIAAINNTGIGAGNLTLGTLQNARLDTSVKRVNDTTTLNISNITAPSDCAANNFAYGFSNVLTCRADQAGNTSNQIFVAVDNRTFHRYNDTMTATNLTASITSAQLAQAFSILWGNVTGRTLDIVWTGGLRWGNITNRDLNIVWANTLGGRNITNATLGNQSLTSDFTLRWGNITNRDLNIVWANSLDWGNISNRNLNTAWTGTLHGWNITNGTLANNTLTSTFLINWGNVSSRSLDIAWQNNAGGLGAGNITTGTLKNTILDTKVYLINQTSLLTAQNLTTGTINSTHFVANLGLGIGNLSVTQDFNMNSKNITNVLNTTYGASAQAQIYWNGSHLRIQG